jgi:hypothetical protein
MSLTARLRLLMAAALASAALGLLTVELSAAGPIVNPCTEAGALCPDLKTASPGKSDWLDLRRTGRRRLLLRLSNRIGNAGTGPLELRKAATTPQACIDEAPDHDPQLSRGVVQRIFEDDPSDTDSLGYFDRGDDTEFSDHAVGCYFFHGAPGHNHWHFQDFAEYRLERLDGTVVGQGTKVGFCVLDQTTPFDPDPPGTPATRHYPTGPAGSTSCTDTEDPVSSQGLSIGFADVYTYATPGQSIDITGISRGKYCLVSTANPLPRLHESDSSSSSNARRTKVQIKPHEDLVRERSAPC